MDDEETFQRGKALATRILDTIGQQRSGEMLMAIAFLAAGQLRGSTADLAESRQQLDGIRAVADDLLVRMWSAVRH